MSVVQTLRQSADSDLPASNATRWVVRRKIAVVSLIRLGRLSYEEASAWYGFSISELNSLERRLERYGADALRSKCSQAYKEVGTPTPGVVGGSKNSEDRSVIKCGDFVIAPKMGSASIREQPLQLEPKEFQVLMLLCLRSGKTVTKEMFLDYLYEGKSEPDIRIIDVYICKLRKKIAQVSDGENYIETVWGRGYMLRELKTK